MSDLIEIDERVNNLVIELDHVTKLIGEIKLGLPLVWVWTWDTICSFYNDDEVLMKSKQEVLNTLIAHSDKEGFSLEYGAEEHYEHVRDWLISTGLMKSCEMCECHPPRSIDSKYCEDCWREYKESDNE